MKKNRTHRNYGGSHYLPRSQHVAFGTQEETARRLDAEQGSARLLKAIQRYFERRAA